MSREKIKVDLSISHTKYFDTQKELGEFLGLKNSDKNSLTRRSKRLGYEVEFPEKQNKKPLK